MEAFLVSAGIVALAEIGDKTQLLSLVLAARFKRPWPIILGIFVAAHTGRFAAATLLITVVLGEVSEDLLPMVEALSALLSGGKRLRARNCVCYCGKICIWAISTSPPTEHYWPHHRNRRVVSPILRC